MSPVVLRNRRQCPRNQMYKLVNLKVGGMLVDMMKRACQNKQFAEIDHAIKTKVIISRRFNESDV